MPQQVPDPIDAGDTSSPHLASERNFADASTFRGGPWADAHIIETGMDADRFPREVVDQGVLGRAVERFRRDRIPPPAFRELAEPSTIPGPILAALGDWGADEAHPLNLFRVHGYKGADRMRRVEVPQHVELPSELTGVDARSSSRSVTGSRYRRPQGARRTRVRRRRQHLPDPVPARRRRTGDDRRVRRGDS